MHAKQTHRMRAAQMKNDQNITLHFPPMRDSSSARPGRKSSRRLYSYIFVLYYIHILYSCTYPYAAHIKTYIWEPIFNLLYFGSVAYMQAVFKIKLSRYTIFGMKPIYNFPKRRTLKNIIYKYI